MKILIFMHNLRRGGAERLVLTLAPELKKRGHEVLIASMFEINEYPEMCDGLNIKFLSKFSPQIGKWPHCIPTTAWKLRKIIKDFKPDVIEWHLPGLGEIIALAKGKTPAVRVFQAPVRKCKFWKWEEYWGIKLTKSTCISIADSVAIDLKQTLGIDSKVVYNAIDLEKFPFALKPVKESPVIAIIGTICPRKRPDLGLKSLKELTKHYPNAKLKFIGDGPLRQEIEDMTHQMLLDDNVIFTGQVADIPDALEHVNLLWMLSDYEGLGMVSVEAMACGVPVIGSDVAGTQDVIDNGVTGYLVPWNDVGATVDRTLKLVRNPELMKSFAYAGRKRAENHFASGKMVDGHEAVFLEVVSTTVNS